MHHPHCVTKILHALQYLIYHLDQGLDSDDLFYRAHQCHERFHHFVQHENQVSMGVRLPLIFLIQHLMLLDHSNQNFLVRCDPVDYYIPINIKVCAPYPLGIQC